MCETGRRAEARNEEEIKITPEMLEAGASVVADYFDTIEATAQAALREALKEMIRACEHHSAIFRLPD
jgi:hypothetical protein